MAVLIKNEHGKCMNWKKLRCLFRGHKYMTKGYTDNYDGTSRFYLQCSDCGKYFFLDVPVQVMYTYEALKIHEQNKEKL